MSSSLRRWKGPSSAPARSRPTDGFSAMTRVLGIQNTIAPAAIEARWRYWPRAPQRLLLLCSSRVLARAQGAVPLACRRPGEPARGGWVRPGGQSHLEFRSMAARDAALAPKVSPVHGEIGAVLVAAGQADHRRGRLPGATWGAGRRGDEESRRARAPGPCGDDVPRGHAPAKGAREAAPAEVAHRRGADRARGGRAARAGRDLGNRQAGSARPATRALREAHSSG